MVNAIYLKSGSLKTGKKCSECPKLFDQVAPNQFVCSEKCRAKRQARRGRKKYLKSK